MSTVLENKVLQEKKVYNKTTYKFWTQDAIAFVLIVALPLFGLAILLGQILADGALASFSLVLALALSGLMLWAGMKSKKFKREEKVSFNRK